MTETTTPLVVRETFPATITRPDSSTWNMALAACTADGQFHVWIHDGNRVDHVVSTTYDRDKSTFGQRHAPRAPWRVSTPLGHFSVVHSGGCGCGHPLKGYRPWTPWRVGVLR